MGCVSVTYKNEREKQTFCKGLLQKVIHICNLAKGLQKVRRFVETMGKYTFCKLQKVLQKV